MGIIGDAFVGLKRVFGAGGDSVRAQIDLRGWDSNSFNGSGNTWIDMSGYGRNLNGTTYGGAPYAFPTYTAVTSLAINWNGSNGFVQNTGPLNNWTQSPGWLAYNVFRGLNSIADVPGRSMLTGVGPSNPRTDIFWYKAASGSNRRNGFLHQAPVSACGFSGGTAGSILYGIRNGSTEIQIGLNSIAGAVYNTGVNLSTNWEHIAFTYDGFRMQVYRSGVLVYTTPILPGVDIASNATNLNFRYDRCTGTGGNDNRYNAYNSFGAYAMYNGILSATEILADYNATSTYY